MELIANLQLSFARPSDQAKAPRNLLELAALLRRARPGAEVAGFARLWAQELTRIQQADDAVLSQKRGSLRRLWAEQSLIYQDLVAALELAAEQICHGDVDSLEQTRVALDELLEEFADTLQEMGEWARSEQPRCFSCSWDGAALLCPHCGLQVLRPVRQPRAAVAPLALAAHHVGLFRTVEAVLQGGQDLHSLVQPLDELHDDFCQAAVDAAACAQIYPEMEPVAEILEVAREGLSEMRLVFEDFDAQHLEDGWHQFFLSQITLNQVVSEEDSDQLRFSGE